MQLSIGLKSLLGIKSANHSVFKQFGVIPTKNSSTGLIARASILIGR